MQISDAVNAGQPHVSEEQNPQGNSATSHLTKWLDKLTAQLLSKKSGNFSAWVIEACRRNNVRKKAYTSIKSDEEWTSRVLPSEQDDIVNS